MKKVCITYHMTRKIENGRETAETCIVLPMADDAADDLIAEGESSTVYLANIDTLLEELSAIQAHEYVGFCHAGLADEDAANDGDEPKVPRYRVVWCDFEGNAHEISCITLEDAVAEMRYLEDCPTQGPVVVREARPTAKTDNGQR